MLKISLQDGSDGIPPTMTLDSYQIGLFKADQGAIDRMSVDAEIPCNGLAEPDPGRSVQPREKSEDDGHVKSFSGQTGSRSQPAKRYRATTSALLAEGFHFLTPSWYAWRGSHKLCPGTNVDPMTNHELRRVQIPLLLGAVALTLSSLPLAGEGRTLQRWLMKEYDFDERSASLLMGHALEYEIANVVDPHFTVVAKLRRSFLSR